MLIYDVELKQGQEMSVDTVTAGGTLLCLNPADLQKPDAHFDKKGNCVFLTQTQDHKHLRGGSSTVKHTQCMFKGVH